MIDEKVLLSLMKAAKRREGYTVVSTDENVCIYTNLWAVEMERGTVPRKILGTLVEDMGKLPEIGSAYEVTKEDAQMVAFEMACTTSKVFFGGTSAGYYAMLPVRFSKNLIFQMEGGTHCKMMLANTAELVVLSGTAEAYGNGFFQQHEETTRTAVFWTDATSYDPSSQTYKILRALEVETMCETED